MFDVSEPGVFEFAAFVVLPVEVFEAFLVDTALPLPVGILIGTCSLTTFSPKIAVSHAIQIVNSSITDVWSPAALMANSNEASRYSAASGKRCAASLSLTSSFSDLNANSAKIRSYKATGKLRWE